MAGSRFQIPPVTGAGCLTENSDQLHFSQESLRRKPAPDPPVDQPGEKGGGQHCRRAWTLTASRIPSSQGIEAVPVGEDRTQRPVHLYELSDPAILGGDTGSELGSEQPVGHPEIILTDCAGGDRLVMNEIEKVISSLAPKDAARQTAIALKQLLPLLDEEGRARFIMDLLG